MAKQPLSVAIISYNEANRIGYTLESVGGIASEIIIVDSHSTDNTVEIASSYGAKVFTEDWKGFAAQKNSALEKCSNSWILCLDSDESLTEELSKEIEAVIKKNEPIAYIINRKTEYLGKLLKYSWQPDNKLRLVHKVSSPLWQGDVVHESLTVSGRKERLKNYMVHRSYRNISDHMAKTVKYAELSAKDYYKRGKKPSILKMLFSPIFAFCKLYFLNLGILDGVPGLIAAASAYIYGFLKYAFLWDMVRQDKNGRK